MQVIIRGRKRTGVILAGGRSERFSANGGVPKPLGKIFDVPMVLQVAASLADAGAKHVIILSGANHRQIVEELDRYKDMNLELRSGTNSLSWEVRYSGDNVGTAGRLLSLDKGEVGDDCLLSYTDVFSHADLHELSLRRRKSGAAMSVLAVNPRLPWGEIIFHDENVRAFKEKPIDMSRWVNGGIFSMNAEVLDYVHSTDEMLEEAPISRLIQDSRLVAMKFDGWWRSVDTPKALREIRACPVGASRWVRAATLV